MKCSLRWRPVILVALFFLGLAPPGMAQARRVLLLYDERTDLPGLKALDARLVQTLSTGLPGGIEIYREAMDLSRFQSERYPRLLRDDLRAKYAGKKTDVVIAALGPALDFMLADGIEVFPGGSVVFCGIDRRELGGRRLPANFTGVLLKRAAMLQIALRLQPGTRRVLLVAETPSSTAGWSIRPERTSRRHAHGFRSSTWSVYRWPICWTPSGSPHHAPSCCTPPSSPTAPASPSSPMRSWSRSRAPATAPVYGFFDQFLGRGIVGGHLYSLDAHGAAAARFALQILAGTSPSALPPVEPSSSRDMFDGRQLRRWRYLRAPLAGRGHRVVPHDLTLGALSHDYSHHCRCAPPPVRAPSFLCCSSAVSGFGLRRHCRETEARAAEQRSQLMHLGRVALVGELSAALAHENETAAGRNPYQRPCLPAACWSSASFDTGRAERHSREYCRRTTCEPATVIDHVRNLVRKEQSSSGNSPLALTRWSATMPDPYGAATFNIVA